MFSRTSRFEARPSSARRLDTKPTPLAIASAGLRGAIGSPSSVSRPESIARVTEDRPSDRVMPGAAQAHEPQGFAGRDGERDRADMLGDETLDRQRDAIGRLRRPHERVAHRASDDHLHQFAGVGLARRDRRQPAAIAKNRHSIGDAQDLVQTMSDVDDSDVAGAQSPQGLEQTFDVGLGKRRGRLVENEDVRLDRQRPADRDQRTLGGRQRRDQRLRVEFAAHDRERLGGGVSHSRPRYETGPRSRIAGLDRDVLRDRHPLDESEILMDEGDRERVRFRMGRPSGKQDVPGVGLVDPSQYFDQGRFARPVLSEERVDLSATDVEVDVIERERAGEALDEPGHREQRRRSAVRTKLVDRVQDRSRCTIIARSKATKQVRDRRLRRWPGLLRHGPSSHGRLATPDGSTTRAT